MEPRGGEPDADWQQQIAALRRELAARDTAFSERIAHQAATLDVLKAMSASPGDPQPVFDLIARQARDVCACYGVSVHEYDGTLLHLRAWTGVSHDQAVRDAYVARFPRVPTGESSAERAILERRVVHVRDLQAEAGTAGLTAYRTVKSVVAVPMLRGGVAIGALGMGSLEAEGFSDSQVELLQTFAEQAVIAITNAETYRALAARTGDLREALEQKTATAEVLGVINASPGNLAPVFDAIAQRARVLCAAQAVTVYQYEGDLLHMRAHAGYDAATIKPLRDAFPRPAGRETLPGRVVLAAAPVIIADISADADFFNPSRNVGTKSGFGVPLLQDGRVYGCIVLTRFEISPFTPGQIALVENFAAQAVIAMENARLITETREALEQQTATAEVLGVINASPGNLAPVFDAMLEKAMRLCGAAFGILRRFDGEHLHTLATYGVPPDYAAYLDRNVAAPEPGALLGPVLATGKPAQILNMVEGIAYKSGLPGARAIADLGGARTVVHVPLVKDGVSRGLFTLYRQEVHAFSDKQIALLQNFAAQAVIAIENARLITETREALEQQTATAEVLRVINASPGDLAPVFDAVLEKSLRLCGAAFGLFHTYDGEQMHCVALRGVPQAMLDLARQPFRPTPGGSTDRLIRGENLVHVADITAEATHERTSPVRRALAEIAGARAMVWVALRKDGALLGTIMIYRQEVRAFGEKQIALLENFAAQAVIAMENARLITETREALERQTATAEVLGVINASPGDLAPVFDAILEKGLRLIDAAFGGLWVSEGETIRSAATRGSNPALARFRAEHPVIATPPSAQRARETRRTVQLLDARESEGYRAGQPGPRAIVDLGGARTMLMVPLLTETGAIGYVQVYRREVRAFTEQQIALLENFAAQAVIAMENARLLNEIRAARDEAETTLADLRRTQDRLVQTEKMASLGQLTAGIAHEIKNPLNFVNNFSDLSVELLDELNEAVAPGKFEIPDETRAEIDDLTTTLQGNLRKIVEHGKRADSIVKNMLLHSRSGTAERRAADLNAIAEEALSLAYHGARAETPGFNITMEKDLDPAVGELMVFPQEISRVLVNLINNGFYAAHKRAAVEAGFVPVLRLSTKDLGGQVEIRVRDNGTGIPPDLRGKIFEPFFTTKPAGQGTGLGLSLSFDIVVKQHGGQLHVASEPGEFTEFTVTLPRQPRPAEEGRG